MVSTHRRDLAIYSNRPQPCSGFPRMFAEIIFHKWVNQNEQILPDRLFQLCKRYNGSVTAADDFIRKNPQMPLSCFNSVSHLWWYFFTCVSSKCKWPGKHWAVTLDFHALPWHLVQVVTTQNLGRGDKHGWGVGDVVVNWARLSASPLQAPLRPRPKTTMGFPGGCSMGKSFSSIGKVRSWVSSFRLLSGSKPRRLQAHYTTCV